MYGVLKSYKYIEIVKKHIVRALNKRVVEKGKSCENSRENTENKLGLG